MPGCRVGLRRSAPNYRGGATTMRYTNPRLYFFFTFLTTVRHEASRGLIATAELLIDMFIRHSGRQQYMTKEQIKVTN